MGCALLGEKSLDIFTLRLATVLVMDTPRYKENTHTLCPCSKCVLYVYLCHVSISRQCVCVCVCIISSLYSLILKCLRTGAHSCIISLSLEFYFEINRAT